MPSYESLIGDALLSSDPDARRIAEDKVTVKMLVSRVIFCPYTGIVMDERRAVVLERADGSPVTVLSSFAWDEVKDSAPVVAVLRAEGARVIDARELYAPKPAVYPLQAREVAGGRVVHEPAGTRAATYEHNDDGRVYVTYTVAGTVVRRANFATERGARQSVLRFLSAR